MKAKNYRRPEGMPYARVEYIHGPPPTRIAKFTAGSYRDDYTHELLLLPETNLQIRDVSLESARVALNKQLTEKLGGNFYMELKTHPHVVLRENKMIFGAHADRLQEGMRRAFGKPVGRAARVEKGQPVFRVLVYGDGVEKAREALQVAAKKLPKHYYIIINNIAPQKAG
ncbi:MAG TPA: 50S ribosomal protein L16 [Candidatus Caldiarchaeum subterraneum]|uniref:50S ribosomal protein L16 n=1 Tax=Caldiarchaeum subterraneum TaxID=311458 RepID=A0A833ECW9_CALS0|nr:50S ribosomal protein L16 [Candidatus Caldarchaeum subterraneum]